jgi:hypothetical protein
MSLSVETAARYPGVSGGASTSDPELPPDEQESDIFTELVDPKLCSAGRRPMLFFVGVTRLNRFDLARTIVVHGGRLSTSPNGDMDRRGIIPLADDQSRVKRAGRHVYSDRYIAESIEAGRALDLEDFRLGRRKKPLSRTELVAAHAAAASGLPMPQFPKAGDAPPRKYVRFSKEDDALLLAYAAASCDSSGVQRCAEWAKARETKVLGRSVSADSLRNSYREHLAPTKMPRKELDSHPANEIERRRSPSRESERLSRSTGKSPVACSDALCVNKRCHHPPATFDESTSGHGRIEKNAKKYPSSHLRRAVRSLSKKFGVSERRAFRVLKDCNSDVTRAKVLLAAIRNT